MSNPKPKPYDLGRLERWITYSNPKKMADELDEIMTDLVAYSGWDDSYYEFLEKRFFLLRQLRDIFWEMEKNKRETA